MLSLAILCLLAATCRAVSISLITPTSTTRSAPYVVRNKYLELQVEVHLEEGESFLLPGGPPATACFSIEFLDDIMRKPAVELCLPATAPFPTVVFPIRLGFEPASALRKYEGSDLWTPTPLYGPEFPYWYDAWSAVRATVSLYHGQHSSLPAHLAPVAASQPAFALLPHSQRHYRIYECKQWLCAAPSVPSQFFRGPELDVTPFVSSAYHDTFQAMLAQHAGTAEPCTAQLLTALCNPGPLLDVDALIRHGFGGAPAMLVPAEANIQAAREALRDGPQVTCLYEHVAPAVAAAANSSLPYSRDVCDSVHASLQHAVVDELRCLLASPAAPRMPERMGGVELGAMTAALAANVSGPCATHAFWIKSLCADLAACLSTSWRFEPFSSSCHPSPAVSAVVGVMDFGLFCAQMQKAERPVTAALHAPPSILLHQLTDVNNEYHFDETEKEEHSMKFPATRVLCRPLKGRRRPDASHACNGCILHNVYYFQGEWFLIRDDWNMQPHLQLSSVARANCALWPNATTPSPAFCSTSVHGDIPFQYTIVDGADLRQRAAASAGVDRVTRPLVLLSRTLPTVLGHVIVDEYLPASLLLDTFDLPHSAHQHVRVVLMDTKHATALSEVVLQPLTGGAPLLRNGGELCAAGQLCWFSHVVVGSGCKRYLFPAAASPDTAEVRATAFRSAQQRWVAFFAPPAPQAATAVLSPPLLKPLSRSLLTMSLKAQETRPKILFISRASTRTLVHENRTVAAVRDALPGWVVDAVVLELLPMADQVRAVQAAAVVVAVDGSALELVSLSLNPAHAMGTGVLTLVPHKGYSHLHFHNFMQLVFPGRVHLAVEAPDCISTTAPNGEASGTGSDTEAECVLAVLSGVLRVVARLTQAKREPSV